MSKTLIIGAGAIGRGFLAPILFESGHKIDFVENQENTLDKFKKRNKFSTALIKNNQYIFKEINFGKIYTPETIKNIDDYDAIFLSVGVRNFLKYANFLSSAKLVFILENEFKSSSEFKKNSKNMNVFFGIPDVIVSNTAPEKLLAMDNLTVCAEEGDLILEQGNYDINLGEIARKVNEKELQSYWACKFFIHNTCHAIVAFLGAYTNCTYVHEAIKNEKVNYIVSNAMFVITEALIDQKMVDKNDAKNYMERELRRFRNDLLHDPISRVARDPLRKLAPEDRLIQALNLVNKSNLEIQNICIGIKAALKYKGSTKEDAEYLNFLSKSSEKILLRDISKIEDNKIIEKISSINLDKTLNG